MNSKIVLGALIALSVDMIGCGDDGPQLQEGAGIRFTFPVGADTLDWVRVGLWDTDEIPPPGCDSLAAARLGAEFPRLGTEPDCSCDLWSFRILDYIDRLVRVEEQPEVGWLWDGRDDAGDPVPSGLYSYVLECLEGPCDTAFATSDVYVLRPEDQGLCEWPLWTEEIAPTPGVGSVSFAPFPESSGFRATDGSGGPDLVVNFVNPFLARVHAPGMETFEAEIVLRDGSTTDVAVVFTPAAAKGMESP